MLIEVKNDLYTFFTAIALFPYLEKKEKNLGRGGCKTVGSKGVNLQLQFYLKLPFLNLFTDLFSSGETRKHSGDAANSFDAKNTIRGTDGKCLCAIE